MATATNVTAAKPKVGGALSVAPLGTTLPTDATTALNTAFVSLGYISEDGLTNGSEISSDDVTAWGGDTVLNIWQGRKDTFSFTLLEATNVDVLKYVFGEDNVTGTLSDGIVIKVSSEESASVAMVFDMVLRDKSLKRICIPNGKITDLGDITYSDSDAVGYEATVSCVPDTSGNMHYEYIKAASNG